MFTRSRCYLLLILLFVFLLAACGTSAPAPTPTVILTEPPTSTPIPPTATSVPTNTAVPPTNTPLPTATPRPTETPAPTNTPLPTNTPKPAATKAVTPKPTNTKGATAPGTSHSPLETAIVQARNAVEDIGGFLDTRVFNSYGGATVRAKDAPCDRLVADQAVYDNALEMDVSAQPANVQNAYQLYRQAVDLYRTEVSIGKYCSSEENIMNPKGAAPMRAQVTQVGRLLTEALNALMQ